MTDLPPPVDNRRLMVRIFSTEMVRILNTMSKMQGGDLIEMLVFVAVWVANAQHLSSQTERYIGLHDIVPDSQRVPISDEDLVDLVCIPRDIVDRYVDRLLANGSLERRSGGLVAPSAVFTRPDQIESTKELYARMQALVVTLRNVGFRTGDGA